MTGELQLVQVDCPRWIGESMIVIGPSGRVVLIDTGSARHANEIAAELEARTGRRVVDAVLLTHYHSDHIGGLDALVAAGVEIGEVIDRGDVHLEAANRPVLARARRTGIPHRPLCTEEACELPFALDLGEGATLTVFAVDGVILGERFPDVLNAGHTGENGRSLTGLVRWGNFAYVFSGDLSGGGKITPDVEGFYAPRIPETLVPASGVELLHLGHHGIRTSANQAWLDRLLPSTGGDRGAITGTSASYLDAPADSVLDRLRGRLGTGAVWIPQIGVFSASDPLVEVARGSVTVRVDEGGDRWAVSGGHIEQVFSSIPD